MKARGRRPSAFVASRCLELLMKPDARLFEMTSPMKRCQIMQCYIFFNFSLKRHCLNDSLYLVGKVHVPNLIPIKVNQNN